MQQLNRGALVQNSVTQTVCNCIEVQVQKYIFLLSKIGWHHFGDRLRLGAIRHCLTQFLHDTCPLCEHG